MPVPNLPRMAGAPGFEPGRAGLESASLPLILRPFAYASGGVEPPSPSRGHSFTGCCRTVSASDARLSFREPRKINLTKAGAVPRLRHLKVFRLSNSKKKERAFLAPPQEAGPLRTSLYELFRDLGSGRPPPAGLTLNLVTIQAKRAFGSKAVALPESAADIYRRRRRTDDA